MQEKRQHPRKPLHPPIAFILPGGERVEAACGDISLGGAFIQTQKTAPFGTKVTVLLTLPGIEKEVPVESTVRWTKAGGMGVQFGLMGARETHALVGLMKA